MRAKDFIVERSKIPDSHSSATPDMRGHKNLDNSSPYAPWRFASNFLPGANGKDPYEHEPHTHGPNGQSLVTVSFTPEEEAIVNQAEKKFGKHASPFKITGKGSKELEDVNKTSPVAKPKKNKYGI